jgi:hypothetical protein
MRMPVLLAGLAIACCAQAAEPPSRKGRNLSLGKPAVTSPAADAVAAARTAVALARYGDTHQDALALIVAAQMLRQAEDVAPRATRLGSAAPAVKRESDPFASDVVLARARALAAGQPELLALAEDSARRATRGARASGPPYIRSVAKANTIDTWRISFAGGSPAAVALSGDGDSDLDLFVHDENNNLVCSSTSPGDDEFCRWHPRWTGFFFIRIRNSGTDNQYVLRTN